MKNWLTKDLYPNIFEQYFNIASLHSSELLKLEKENSDDCLFKSHEIVYFPIVTLNTLLFKVTG